MFIVEYSNSFDWAENRKWELTGAGNRNGNGNFSEKGCMGRDDLELMIILLPNRTREKGLTAHSLILS